MNKSVVMSFFALATAFAVTSAEAQVRRNTRTTRGVVGQVDASSPALKRLGVIIETPPKMGDQCTFVAPSLAGASSIGQCYTRPRKWIVLETKYRTDPDWLDRLTFTWHVLLETESATENRDKESRKKLAPYSYFTTTVPYINIPRGSHAASVCLPPFFLERFGQVKAIGLVISNAEGEVILKHTATDIQQLKKVPEWWTDPRVMEAKQGDKFMVERRQGLIDRSKTIWGLVNPNDYEMVGQ